MIFKNIPPPFEGESIPKYLSSIMKTGLLDIVDGLHKLTLADNITSFQVEVTLASGEELRIRNEFNTFIPSGRIIVKHTGDPAIVDGDTDWDNNYVYLKNAGSVSATVTVLYFK